MADKPSWEEVKKVLDNPDVPDDLKKELTLKYASADGMGWFRTNPDATPYLNKYDDGYGATVADAFGDGGNDEALQEAYDKAKKSADEAAAEDKKHDDAVKAGKDSLEKSRKSAQEGGHGGAGAAKSDELLDAGKPGLRFFHNFVPLYHKIEHDYNDKSKVPQVKQIEDRYHEQRGINFDKFATGIQDMKAAESGLRKAHQDMANRLGNLWQGWTGGASQSSQKFFSGAFTPTAQERVIETVSDSASMTEDTLKAVGDLCRAKAQAVLDLDSGSDQIAGKAEQDWDTTIQVANHTDDDETLRKACSIWNIQIDEDCGDLTDEVKNKITDECRKMVRNTFAKTVEGQCSNFTKLCDDTKKKIDDAWKKLNEELGKAEENPFAKPGGDQQPGDDKGKQGGGQDGQQGGGQQGAGGGGGSAGGGGAGGGTPSAPGGVPETPQAPEMPKPGDPPADPAQQGNLDKVTVGEGKDGVTVQEPDQQGNVQVTVMGEDGKPKTYDVAFGGGQPMPGQPVPGAVPGQPGMVPGQVGAEGQPVPGVPPAPGQPPVGTMPGQAAGQPPIGPVPGQPGQPPIGTMPAPGGAIPVQPGEDGKAVINEGNRTITLEKTPDGDVKVSVDNGGGQAPMNQTIDFGDGPPAPGTGPPDLGVPAGGPSAPPPPDPAVGPPPDPAAGPPPGTPVGGAEVPSQPAYSTSESPQAEPAGATSSAFSGGADTAQAAAPAPPTEVPAATTPQSAGFSPLSGLDGEGVRNSFGSASGQLMGDGAHDGAQSGRPDGQFPGQPAGDQSGAAGLASIDGAKSGSPQGATGLASMGESAPAGGGGQQPGGGQGSGQGGGMMGGGMMGGMGGAGAQGGDQERTNSSPWRTQGQLFDDGIEASNVRYHSVLGEDRDR